MSEKVFIIGWDGATWDLMRPWVAEGKLPNIAKIMEAGASGNLRSTLPPMTFPAWTSFMTGKNPGKHGIYDFTRPKPGSYELEFVNGGQRQAPTFWQLLSEAGRRVISISVPGTYPPEKVNGIMLSGFDAPGMDGANQTLDARAMYPPELCEELNRETGGHPIGSFPMADINAGRPQVAIEKILQVVREKARTTKYLMQNKDWDCMMILFGESDGVGHHFWKYCDPDCPLFTEEPSGLRDSIYRVYKELDDQLGEFKEMLPEGTTLLMMSDHGFGGVSNCVLYPNCWLREQQLLDFRGRAARWQTQILEAAKLRAVSFLPLKIKRMVFRLLGSQVGNIESRVRFGMIDWSKTKAYFEENPYYPAMWINVKGRQPGGIVEPGEEYEQLRSDLIVMLEDWRHPDTGEALVLKAYRREEVYQGDCVELAPDIVIHWNEHQNYTYAYKLSSKSKDLKWTEYVDPNEEENLIFFTGKSGRHRDEGIFLAEGDTIGGGIHVDGAKIVDVAPTILHLLDVPIPADMDGRPLMEIMREEFRSREVQTTNEMSMASSSEESSGYSSEDQLKIAARLKALGYID